MLEERWHEMKCKIERNLVSVAALYLSFAHWKVQEETIEDHFMSCTRLGCDTYSFSHTVTLSCKRCLVACLWSRDQPLSRAQCQLFCIGRVLQLAWFRARLAYVLNLITFHTLCQPNYTTMQVFHDIASVTAQLIDCSHSTNGITGPVRSEIHQRQWRGWCFTAVLSWNNKELECITENEAKT